MIGRLTPLRRLALALLAAVVAAGAAAAVALNGDAEYRGRVVLVIDQPGVLATTAGGGPLDQLTRLRLKYVDLVPTAEVAGRAAEELDLPVSTVTDAVTAEAPELSLAVVIDARAGERRRAGAVADAVARSLVDYVEAELQRADVPAENRYGFEVVAPATVTKLRPTVDTALRAAVPFGLLTMGAAYLLLEVLGAVRLRGGHD